MGAVVSATLLSACGSQLGPAALGTETTTTTRPTTTTAPPETTSTVDFDRPVRQQLTPLPEEPTVADVEGMIRDIRGQTDDVSAQMARLVRFVDIATPVPAQIIDIGIRIDVANDEGLHEQRAAVLFRTGATVDEVLTFLDHQLRGAGWNRSKSERIQVDGIETVVESFRVPGVPASEEELTVRVADGPDATRIELAHFSLSADHAAAWELLPAWHDGLPLPRGAERAGITLRTEDDVGSVMVTHDVGAETPAEARSAFLALIGRSSDYEVTGGGATTGDVDVDDPVELVDADGGTITVAFTAGDEPETVRVDVVIEFRLDPLDP